MQIYNFHSTYWWAAPVITQGINVNTLRSPIVNQSHDEWKDCRSHSLSSNYKGPLWQRCLDPNTVHCSDTCNYSRFPIHESSRAAYQQQSHVLEAKRKLSFVTPRELNIARSIVFCRGRWNPSSSRCSAGWGTTTCRVASGCFDDCLVEGRCVGDAEGEAL